jgi:hypothetical protein
MGPKPRGLRRTHAKNIATATAHRRTANSQSQSKQFARTAAALFSDFDDEAFCFCPAAKCVSGIARLCFAGGSLKAV